MPHYLLNQFSDALANATQRLNFISASGKKIIGYFCTYTPIEIIHACGFLPIRVLAGSGIADKASARAPDFICPSMRLSLEKALNGQFDFLAGIVQGYSCDAACGMVNIWKNIFNDRIFHSIPIPYNDTVESEAYYRSAIFELINVLEGSGSSFSQPSLQNSLDTYAHIRKLQLDLYHRRYAGALSLSASELMTVVDAGFLMPPEQYLFMLNKFVNQLPWGPDGKNEGCPVLITGSLIENAGILDIIEAAGGRIVADDLCNGFRQMYPPQGEGKTPMERVIDRYANRFPCPARARAIDRSRRIGELIKLSGARGVIFVLEKFCTPHLADYPILAEELKNNGISSLMIEMDETWNMEAQLKTRLESFFEMLEI
ncbi:MAG: 2-hydroxyacyl-CoA dehydratase family protein [Desulfobacterales bacterium]|jgi:benzoyl-CoA reductase/2-hydroxyglutaryl-CoA dehydratase subunit BcrC/BadD/HgdB|nr:2-hydroxyacyl-CoA dehydratase family protein [Desulfobacterales bacterium]